MALEDNVVEFENKCMELIEKIVMKDIRNTRKDAIVIAEQMLAKAKTKTKNATVIAVLERVIKEFKIATDQEYILLRGQLFS